MTLQHYKCCKYMYLLGNRCNAACNVVRFSHYSQPAPWNMTCFTKSALQSISAVVL